jgi:hypothetical protein
MAASCKAFGYPAVRPSRVWQLCAFWGKGEISMLNKLKRFIGSNEPVQQKSEEIEQQQYIQYAQELEQSLSKLEAGVHESDDSSWIMQSVMKTALDFYTGDWIGFLEVDLELGLWTPTHWYNPSPNDKTLDLFKNLNQLSFFIDGLLLCTTTQRLLFRIWKKYEISSPVNMQFIKG